MPSDLPPDTVPGTADLGRAYVTVIGGGAGAAMLMMQWIARERWPGSGKGNLGRVIWCEESGVYGLGAAYRTVHPRHLLNVMASRMGALEGRPADFLDWLLQSDHGDAREACKAGAPGERYLPRRLYGQYLRARLQDALATLPAGALDTHDHRVLALEPEAAGGYRVASTGGHWHSAHLVLAMGNRPNPRWNPAATRSPRWLGSVWDGLRPLPEQDGAPLVVLGAGLSAVDTVLSLRDMGWQAPIQLLSRHGHWPQAHRAQPVVPYPHAWADLAGRRPAGLLRHLRLRVREGAEWRGVVDGLRPHSIALWKQWSRADQTRFLKRLWPWWNLHRHRMAPPAAAWLDEALPGPSRQPLAVSVREVLPDAHGLEILLDGHGALQAAAIADCTGPSLSVLSHPGCLGALLEAGILSACANGAGLATDDTHAAHRGLQGTIFALGTLTLGERLETTAIPELRGQAAELAAADF